MTINMKNSLILFILIIIFGCNRRDEANFDVHFGELVAILNDTIRARDFIDKWDLKKCNDNGDVYYCLEDDLITFQYTRNGYIITTDNMPLEKYNRLKSEISKEYELTPPNVGIIKKYYEPDSVIDFSYYEKDEYNITIGRAKNGRNIHTVILGSVW